MWIQINANAIYFNTWALTEMKLEGILFLDFLFWNTTKFYTIRVCVLLDNPIQHFKKKPSDLTVEIIKGLMYLSCGD